MASVHMMRPSSLNVSYAEENIWERTKEKAGPVSSVFALVSLFCSVLVNFMTGSYVCLLGV